jgi:hypothetical protein
MRTLALRSAAVGLALALFAHPATAQHRRDRHDDDNARVVSRQPLHRAASAIQTRNGEVALLLVGDRLVMQLTDRGLGKVDRDIDDDAKEEGAFARFISGVVRSGVRSLLDHGIEYPLSEIREARFQDGRLVLIDREGDEIFDDVEINDTDVMHSFAPAEARAFAARVNQARRRAEL